MVETADINAIVEEHCLRAYRLWTQRHIPIAWPIEPRGYTFLGNAVHLVGAALFPDWTGKEPEEFHLPALEDGTFQEASESKRLFAKSILPKLDAAAVCNDARSEMSEWKRAVDLYAINVLPAVAAARRKMAVLMRIMIDAAAHQKLSMATRTNLGLLVSSPPSEWTTEWAYPRFAECQMNPFLPFTNTHPTVLFGVNLPGSPIDLIPGNNWIFVETKSLDTFIGSLPKIKAKAQKPTDRSVKKKVPDGAASEWAAKYFVQFSDPNGPLRDDAETAFLSAFPTGSTTQFREKVWPLRPLWMKRRAPRGS